MRWNRIAAALTGLAMLTTTIAAAQSQRPGQPPRGDASARKVLEPTEEVVDFGWVRPGETVTADAGIKNVSDRPVRLLRVTSTCKCTVPKLEDDERIVEPGGVATIPVSLEANDNTGPMIQRIYVWYEGGRAPQAVRLKADVSPPVKAEPFFISMLGKQRSGEITLTSLDGEPFRVLSVDGESPALFDGEGEPLDADKAHSEAVVKWDMTGVPDEDLDRWFVIETDHPEARELTLRVVHPSLYAMQNQRQTWSLGEDRFVLGRLAPGGETTRTVTLRSIEDREIEAVGFASEALDAEILKTERVGRDAKLTVRIKATGASTGLIKTRLEVRAAGEQHEADVIVRVEEAL